MHRLGECKLARVEADPVGVVEDARPPKRLHQAGRIVKRERPGLDAPAERIGAMRRIRQRPHPAPRVQESLGDAPAGVPERPGHNVKFLIRHGRPSPGLWIPRPIIPAVAPIG